MLAVAASEGVTSGRCAESSADRRSRHLADRELR